MVTRRREWDRGKLGRGAGFRYQLWAWEEVWLGPTSGEAIRGKKLKKGRGGRGGESFDLIDAEKWFKRQTTHLEGPSRQHRSDRTHEQVGLRNEEPEIGSK